MTPMQDNWLDIIREQDERLRFDHFTHRDALQIGLNAIKLSERFGKGFAIRVVAEGTVLFSYHMEGTGMFHDWYLDKKLNASREAGISTLRLYCEIERGEREKPAFLENTGNYAVDGGCVTMRMRDGSVFGWVEASGGPHEEDHEVATQAIAQLLGIEVPGVCAIPD